MSEILAAKFHAIYQEEAKRQGDVRHKDAYADLPENIKEFDRVLARYVLENFSCKHNNCQEVEVGRHTNYATHEMAMDAGDLSLEGQSMDGGPECALICLDCGAVQP